jgi:hypothetical protein
MRYWIVVVLAALCACSAQNDYAPLPLEHTPWTVTGILALSDGTHIPNHEIQFIRIQGKSDQDMGGYHFSAVRTDHDGKFYFTSYLSGTYTAIAEFSSFCVAHADLGKLESGQKREVRIVYDKDKDCRVVL